MYRLMKISFCSVYRKVRIKIDIEMIYTNQKNEC